MSVSRIELAGQGRQMRPLAVATIAGGVVGGLLLLVAPAASFEYVVPWLIAGASAAILLPRRPRPATPHRLHQPALIVCTALIGVFGGYFGAASGVLLLALLMAMHDDSCERIVRRTPPAPLRLLVALAGIGLAIDLGWKTYADRYPPLLSELSEKRQVGRLPRA